MASLYDSASLVMIPSGYKEDKIYSIKPTDGSGDLTFSRSNDTATRVNSDGLIEKVRTNKMLQSNTFNTSWTISGTGTVTTGATDPFGGTTAWTLAKTAANTFIYQSTAGFSGSNTFSIYAKAGTVDQLYLNHAQSGAFSSIFDLTLGTAIGAAGCVATIVSVGNGWFRCSIAGTVTSPINLRIYPASGNSTSGTTGSILIYGVQGETSDIATDYIATTTAAVSVGPVANLPRLDYLDSSCPKLLLEPQRTNLVTYSEQINQWSQERTSVTDNAITSPDGYTNADKLNADSTPDTTHQAYNGPFTNTAGNVAFSGFFKKGEYDWVHFGAGLANSKTWFNLNTGVVGSTESDVVSASMEDFGNGWYRCISVVNLATTSNYVEFGPASVDNSRVISGTPSGGIYGWAIQMENASSYATSYIPTLSAASTRGVESALNFSALVNNTAFTLFFEGSYSFPDSGFFDLLIGVNQYSGNYFGFYSGFIAIYNVGSGTQTFGTTLAANTVHKLLIKYDGTTAKYYRNGSLFLSIPATGLGTFGDGYIYNNDQEGLKVNQLLYFPTALTDAEAIALTTL